MTFAELLNLAGAFGLGFALGALVFEVTNRAPDPCRHTVKRHVQTGELVCARCGSLL